MRSSDGATEQWISVSEARRQLSRVLGAVEEGRTFIVVRRGSPVARIEPLQGRSVSTTAARARLLARLESQVPTNIGTWRREELYD